MRTLMLSALICAGFAAWSPFAFAPSSAAYWTPVAVLDFYADPFFLAVRDVESSAGKDCVRKDRQALTCFQVKPASAEWADCQEGWDRELDGSLALACARLVDAKITEYCGRRDHAGRAHFYRWGRCLPRKAKPSGYALDVLDRIRRYL